VTRGAGEDEVFGSPIRSGASRSVRPARDTGSPRGTPPSRGTGPWWRIPGSLSRSLAFLLLGLVLAGCLREPAPPTDPELAESLGIDPRTPVHRVDLVDREGRITLFPPILRVEEGHLVQFVTRDRRAYSVRFLRGEVSQEGWRFLEGRTQSASPPLVSEGDRFVVTFEGAPAGSYPFEVVGQGQEARGEIVVGGG
jgi:hypothetical protein